LEVIYLYFFYVLLADDDGYAAHQSYNGPADVGKTNEGR